MKTLITFSFTLFMAIIAYGQNDVIVEAPTPRVISKMSSSYGGFYFNRSNSIKGGLTYNNTDKTIRLSHTINPHNIKGFTLLTSGTNAGNFAMGMTPGQHYFSIFHDSKKIAGTVNHPSNSAHLALIEDDADDFTRLWFLNSNNPNRWAVIGKTGEDSKVGFAYNGVSKMTIDTVGKVTINKLYTLPNVDGANGQVMTTNGAGVLSWDDASGTATMVEDADADTKITVEETADSDELNFYSENSLLLNMKKDTMFIPKGVFSGYGTDNPLDPIHLVAEDDDEYSGFYAEGGANTKHVHYILDNRTANGKIYSIVSVGDDSSIPNGSFAVRDLNANAERILIDNIGRVGIGVNNPSHKLHVNGNTKVEGNLIVDNDLSIGSGMGALVTVGDETLTDGGIDLLRTAANFTPSEPGTYSLGGFIFKWHDLWMDGVAHIGSVEIYDDGTDILKTNSHIIPEVNNSKSLGSTSLKWKNVILNDKLYIGTQYFSRSSGNNALFTSTNFAPLNDNSFQLGSGTKRWSVIYAANGTINTSDERAKKNIEDLDYGLDEVMQLRPVDFDWKEAVNDKKTIGLIAQELLQVIPEVVVQPENEDELLGVKYADLIPVLIKAIQEQEDKIESLEKTVKAYDTLKAEVADMKASIEILNKNLQN